jgi:hypothetical protein
MSASEQCCVFSFDYLDLDVYLNVTAFYRLAGFRIVNSSSLANCELAILLRGLPPRAYPEYEGKVHFYDYVCEHSFDLCNFFPNASSISIVSLVSPAQSNSAVQLIYGYLPVLPDLWQFKFPFSRSNKTTLHISNYKPLINDAYQDQLIHLILAGRVKAYGSKWERIHLQTRPLSYLAANLLLSSTQACFGLMYPYQRGKSLSGRMWQAPLQGCIVFSEANTNFFHCPGVIELDQYTESSIPLHFYSTGLASAAADFWRSQTRQLATDLELNLCFSRLRREVIRARFLLFVQHMEFTWSYYILSLYLRCKRRLIDLIKRIGRKLLA